MRRQNKKEEGFTLLEVMLSVAILGFSLLAVIQVFSGGMTSAKVSEGYTMAVVEAREKMNETLMKKDLVQSMDSGISDEGYSWSVEITSIDLKNSGASPGILKIVIRVKVPNKSKEVVLETLRTSAKGLANG